MDLMLSYKINEPVIRIEGTYHDSEGGSFDYMFEFRRYGSLWEDQIDSASSKQLPPGYDGYIEELIAS